MSEFILAYDIGTTGVKTCLFEVGEKIDLVAYASRGYGLYILENGGAEQDTEEWWNGMAESTAEVLGEAKHVKPDMISGIAFCSQMQGLVLIDKDGNALGRAV